LAHASKDHIVNKDRIQSGNLIHEPVKDQTTQGHRVKVAQGTIVPTSGRTRSCDDISTHTAMGWGGWGLERSTGQCSRGFRGFGVLSMRI